MSDSTSRAINDVLILLNRSLLQYVGESSPYTSDEDRAVGETVAELVELQKTGVQRLVDLLVERTWPIGFGTYPTDFTDLHFLSLNYLLPQVVENERSLIGEIETAIELCVGDTEAVNALQTTLEEQREIVRRLDERAEARKTTAA